MIAKLTSKNQLTLPEAMVEAVGHPDYFQVDLNDGRLVLTPAKAASADEVRRKLEELGISQVDIEEAVGWARPER